MKIKLPSWLTRSSLQLPPWAKVAKEQDERASIVIEVDNTAAIEAWHEELGSPKLDQYWLEVIYQCIKLDTQAAIARTEHDPRLAGKHASFKFSRADKYVIANYPEGKGIAAATKGREARDHYVRIRGSMPM